VAAPHLRVLTDSSFPLPCIFQFRHVRPRHGIPESKGETGMAMRQQTGLRFTRKTKIVVDFLLELIVYASDDLQSIVEISKRINVHRNYADRLLEPLKKAGYISTTNGGDCRFLADPKKITLLEIVEMVDGAVSLQAMFKQDTHDYKKSFCFSNMWGDMDREIREKLQAITVQDLVDAYGNKAPVRTA
jgi:Rrf2 family protein